jgi:hypothetical protein
MQLMTRHICVPVPRQNLDFKHHNVVVFYMLQNIYFIYLVLNAIPLTLDRYLLIVHNGLRFDLILILIVFNATFSNTSAISWRPVLVVEEAGVPGENHRPWASNW